MVRRLASASLIIIAVLLAVPAYAQTGPSITMDPILVERTARAGETLTYLLNVENGDRLNPLTVEITPVDVVEDAQGLYHARPPGSTSYSLAQWVKVEPTLLTVPPGALRTVQVTVEIPRGVSGGRYGAIAFTIVPDRSEVGDEGVGVSEFSFRTLSFLELVIEGGTTRREAYATSFDVERAAEFPTLRSLVHQDALVFSLGVANEGNIHIVTRGTLTLRTTDGRTVARYPLGGGRGVILPGATVMLRTIIGRALPSGEYEARAVVDYGGPRPVVATVNFSVDEQAVTAQKIDEAPIARLLLEPQEIVFHTRPGAFQSAVLDLTNRGTEPITVHSQILSLAFDPYGDLLPESERDPAPEWIKVTPSSVTLEPGRTRRLRLTAQLPRDMDGGYYADNLFKTNEVGVSTETGASLLLFVGDNAEAKGRVAIQGIEPAPDALNVDTLFVNEGNIHLFTAIEAQLLRIAPQIELEDGRIIPSQTEVLASITVPRGQSPVLPDSVRLFSFLFPGGLSAGEYEVAIRVDYEGAEPAIDRVRFSIEDEAGV